MPSRRMHLAIAVPIGTIMAANKANHLNGLPYFWEVVGGALGAVGGGIGPDWPDPPATPNHRGLGHSLILAVSVGKIVFDRVDTWQGWLRGEAERMRELQLVTPVGMVGSPTEGDENRVQASASTREQRLGRRSLSPIFEGDPLLRVAYGAWEIVLRLLAGALVGLVAGWGSHLALDFGTARSLPLLY